MWEKEGRRRAEGGGRSARALARYALPALPRPSSSAPPAGPRLDGHGVRPQPGAASFIDDRVPGGGGGGGRAGWGGWIGRPPGRGAAPRGRHARRWAMGVSSAPDTGTATLVQQHWRM